VVVNEASLCSEKLLWSHGRQGVFSRQVLAGMRVQGVGLEQEVERGMRGLLLPVGVRGRYWDQGSG